MTHSLEEIIDSYDATAPLEQALTIPASWYTDERICDLELRSVFAGSWQPVCRVNQLSEPGRYITAEIAGEPIVVVRGNDDQLRAFFNVCRHHAATVMTEPEGTANQLRCPYHGWTYSLDGQLKGTPDFSGVCNFDRSQNGLMSIELGVWQQWVFIRLETTGRQRSLSEGSDQAAASALQDFLGRDLIGRIQALDIESLHWLERRHYTFDCNWKVFVDNYLDGGYHVPHLHKGLDSVLDYSNYSIESGERFCLQSSPIVSAGAEPATGAVRKGDRALYYWIYPNLMLNWYQGAMD
ncbi:MAG: aromatic ring-hydroxylating oxygenase subunit alpha, partial [Pyrinomonadaceae bacterium]